MMDFNAVEAIVGYMSLSSDPVMILDPDSRIMFSSRKSAAALGATPSKLIGMSLLDFLPNTGHPHNQSLDILKTDGGGKFKADGVVPAITIDGEEIKVMVSDRVKYQVGDKYYYSVRVEAA